MHILFRLCCLAFSCGMLSSCAGVSKPEPVGALGYALNGQTGEKPVHSSGYEKPPPKSNGQLRWEMKF